VQSLFGNAQDAIDSRRRQLKCIRAHASDRQAVRQGRARFYPNWAARFHCRAETCVCVDSTPIIFTLRRNTLTATAITGNESRATHRNDHGVHLRELLEKLEADRSLSSDDRRVIKALM
jgi:hypothetical protein